MRLRNTIIALVLLAIVGGYAFIVGRYSVPEAPQRLIDVKQDDIAKIELRYSDRDIVLARDKDKPWRLVKPIGAESAIPRKQFQRLGFIAGLRGEVAFEKPHATSGPEVDGGDQAHARRGRRRVQWIARKFPSSRAPTAAERSGWNCAP